MQSTSSIGLSASAPTYVPAFESRFEDVTKAMQVALDRALAFKGSGGKLFRVTSEDLNDTYLSSFKSKDVQYHNCRCCSDFLRAHGNVAWINKNNLLRSALWDETLLPAHHPYRATVKALRLAVENGRIISQAFWDELDWGVVYSGGFNHFAVSAGFFSHRLGMKKAHQWQAESREDRRHLQRALADFPTHNLRTAIDMLKAGALSRGDKIVPMATFLLDLKESMHDGEGGGSRAQDLKLWQAVAVAGAGWCTPRATVLGALMEDLDNRLESGEVRRRHNLRVAPEAYQRPTAPTTAGNVAAAEKIIDGLGLAPALRRRFASAEELVHLWNPKPASTDFGSGVFGHLLPGRRAVAETNLSAHPIRMTFAKFRRDVLPRAQAIEVLVPRHGSFCAFTAAADSTAPPLIAWDSLECRNHWAWYVYNNGSPATQWGLHSMRRYRVEAISLMPSAWGGEEGRWAELNTRALVIIEGAKDSANKSMALFPETLRGDLHEVRRTIEAHSQSGRLEDLPDGVQHAAGLLIGEDETTLTVRTDGGVASYIIDRWE